DARRAIEGIAGLAHSTLRAMAAAPLQVPWFEAKVAIGLHIEVLASNHGTCRGAAAIARNVLWASPAIPSMARRASLIEAWPVAKVGGRGGGSWCIVKPRFQWS
ncbi:MAG: hypothetical protein QNJ15_11085, partial [Erythrobacter sp.]|nr:hypothetical protein [Erythrobacter sp.]